MLTEMRASRAGCMSGVWKPPLTGSSCVFIAPAAFASAATWQRRQHNSLTAGPATQHSNPPQYSCL